MNYNEYRGVRKLVVAEVTKDDSTGYTTEEWQELSGVQSIAHATSESSETHFYDNLSAIEVTSEGADEITLVVSVLATKDRALIEGASYNEAKGLYVGTPKQKKYFALGYIGKKTDGTEEFNILYKGKFTGGDETHNTEDDGTEGTNVTYTFRAIHTSKGIYTESGVAKPAKKIYGALTSTLDETDIFGTFTAGVSSQDVLTPDEIIALS